MRIRTRNQWIGVDKENKQKAKDNIYLNLLPPKSGKDKDARWGDGKMTWNIPWKYRVKNSNNNGVAYKIQDVDVVQYFTLENSGRTVVEKDYRDGDYAASVARTPGTYAHEK